MKELGPNENGHRFLGEITCDLVSTNLIDTQMTNDYELIGLTASFSANANLKTPCEEFTTKHFGKRF